MYDCDHIECPKLEDFARVIQELREDLGDANDAIKDLECERSRFHKEWEAAMKENDHLQARIKFQADRIRFLEESAMNSGGADGT